MGVMMSKVTVLDVLLHDQPIGTLTNVGGDRTIFAFHDGYIDTQNRPVLGLGFKDEFGALLTDFRPYQKRVMPFFSNLLPEGHLRSYLAAKAGINAEREFHLLWALGDDLPGAITIRPADGASWPPDLAGDASTSQSQDDQDTILRFSLAGVQLKFSAMQENSGGLTIPASGIGGSWIVKLPSREYAGVPENEFSMMTLAQMIGMDVPEIDLIDINAIGNIPEGIGQIGGQAFVIKRFDRLPNGNRAHIEDFAQIYGVYAEDKYKNASMRNIAQVLAAEGNDADIVEFIRRLTFNALIGNGDMHLKNWSLIYPDQRNAALAPAYDFVSTVPYIPGDQQALNVSRSKAFADFNEDELADLAAKAALPGKLVLDTARETVALFHQHWASEKANLPMSKEVREAIDAHLKTVPLA
jgi:serine/threonine-protein kinase HipA